VKNYEVNIFVKTCLGQFTEISQVSNRIRNQFCFGYQARSFLTNPVKNFSIKSSIHPSEHPESLGYIGSGIFFETFNP